MTTERELMYLQKFLDICDRHINGELTFDDASADLERLNSVFDGEIPESTKRTKIFTDSQDPDNAWSYSGYGC